MIQLILYFIQLIFSSICLFVNKSAKYACPSENSEESPASSPKPKSNSGGKKKKPKRNRSAFIIFSSEKRAELKSQSAPELNSNEMMVRLAELWRQLPEDEKRAYHDEADKEKVRYLQDLNQFYENNPNEVIQNKTKKNHIKKPCSAYALYLKETKKFIKIEHPDLKMADILKVVAQRWKVLSEEDRSVYQQKALAEKELTKAKMNEMEEPAPEPAKKGSKKNQKTSKKSPKLALDSIKEEYCPSSSPSSSFQLEEPMLQKRQILNVNFQPNPYVNSFAPSYGPLLTQDYEFFFSEIQHLSKSISMNREDSTEMVQEGYWKYQNETASYVRNDFVDLMDFQPMKYESAKIPTNDLELMIKEEEQTTEATHMSPHSMVGRSSNELIMNLLDSETTSFDPFSFDYDEQWNDYARNRQEKSTPVNLF